MSGSIPSSDSNVLRSSSDENDDVLKSDPLLLKELEERKSLVSKKLFSSSSVSSSAASTLSFSYSDSLALSGRRIQKGNEMWAEFIQTVYARYIICNTKKIINKIRI